MAPPVSMTILSKQRPLDSCLHNSLIANLNLYNDSDRQCSVARDGARSHRKVEKLSIPSQPVASDGLDSGRPVDPDIGLS